MEATGRDGGAGGPSWSYRRRHEEIGSSSYTISCSNRSGTIVSSTAYTSGTSRLSSGMSMEAAALLELELEPSLGTPDKIDAEFAQPIKKPRKETKEIFFDESEFAQPIKKPRKETEETLKEKRMKHIKSLVQEFSRAHSVDRGNVPERWFWELGVSWVFHLDGASVSVHGHPTIDELQSWVGALTQIMETIRLTESFFPDSGISEEDSGNQATSLDPLQFALFFQKAMSKMLVLVDFMFNKSTFHLVVGLHVHRALSKVLLGMRLQFHSSTPAEVEKIEKEMVSLLSAKQGKAFDAIWSSMEERRTDVLKSMEDSLGAETPQGSSDIHQATCSVVDHINFLLHKCWAVDPLFVSKAASLGKYVPPTGLEEAQPIISMITEMVSCLEEKLIIKSKSFLDKGLGLLFLLNNSNFIRFIDSLSDIKLDLAAVTSFITPKVEHYTESYIQVSWEPMLACLFNPTPLRLVRKYSPLSKFESEFQKIYTAQKLWKVPDPELRKSLRKAVIEKIIPGYTKYIEDSKVTNPKFTPQELKEMLQELFEG